MKQAITFHAVVLSVGLLCGIFSTAQGYGDGDICVHLNGGADVAFIGVDNTLEIWIENDAGLEMLQFSLQVCWIMPNMFWTWNLGHGDSPPIMRHGHAVDYPMLFGHEESFDNISCDAFIIGASALMPPADNLPASSSRICYSLKFQVISPIYANAIMIMPFAYDPAANWRFKDLNGYYPPNFCGQTVEDMDNPTADPIAFSLTIHICGDANASGGVDIDDVVYLIAYIFSGGPQPYPYEAGDANCSGGVDIDDVVWLISYIFTGGWAPCDTDGDGMTDC